MLPVPKSWLLGLQLLAVKAASQLVVNYSWMLMSQGGACQCEDGTN